MLRFKGTYRGKNHLMTSPALDETRGSVTLFTDYACPCLPCSYSCPSSQSPDQFTEQSRSVPVGIQRWCVSSNLIRRDMVELGTLPYCLTSGFAIFSEIQRFPQLLPNTTGAGLGTSKDECLFKGTVIYCPKLQLRYTQTEEEPLKDETLVVCLAAAAATCSYINLLSSPTPASLVVTLLTRPSVGQARRIQRIKNKSMN
ncbi:hypothetical protein SFRURICE_010814 [Spodoptera frugiperda]|uniref:SFRICE_027507 n=1 Tax=Spodoptera frugiperda TaxID=7108 RepID=A0A2H1W2G5_SPOFR|nr:hypothetical protein SFRURICE_010814 [Spodoptera frugiperda]